MRRDGTKKMITFEEPGSEYDLERIKKKSIAAKIRLLTLLIVFVLVIIFFVKNDFNFNFARTKAAGIAVKCDEDMKFTSQDDAEGKTEKAQLVLNENLEHIEELEGFDGGYVVNEPIGYQKRLIPVIRLEFEGVFTADKRIPEQICGFKTRVVYK